MADAIPLDELQRHLMTAVGLGLNDDLRGAAEVFDTVYERGGWNQLAALSGGLCALGKAALARLRPLPDGEVWGVHPQLAQIAHEADVPAATFAMQMFAAFANDDKDMAGAILRAALEHPDPEFYPDGLFFLLRFTVDLVRELPLGEA